MGNIRLYIKSKLIKEFQNTLAIMIYRWYSYQVVIFISDLHGKQTK